MGSVTALRHDFKDLEYIKEFIKNSKNFDPAVEISDMSEVLLLFSISKQKTWLVATNKRLYCILDDLRKSEPHINWSIPKEQLVDKNKVTVNISDRRYKKSTGLVDIGVKRRGWLYSKKLFRKIDVVTAIHGLIARKMIQESAIEQVPGVVRYGTERERIEVSASEIMEAIQHGQSIDVRYAIIKGMLDMGMISDRLESGEGQRFINGNISIQICSIDEGIDFSNAIFMENVAFLETSFGGKANFESSIFRRNVYFGRSIFGKKAVFSGTAFNGDADFRGANFRGSANFHMTSFSSYADFALATFTTNAIFDNISIEQPADFAEVRFYANKPFVGIWNDILQPIVQFITFGKLRIPKLRTTDFSRFNTNVAMDNLSNPYLKRYIEDEQWIASWRRHSRWRRVLSIIWELTSHSGRSIGLWLFWSVILATVFGFLFRGHIFVGHDMTQNWYTPFYFSVVTFTTLGFGDIKPVDSLGQLWIALEVILGYLMLGGLISIFANKFARRS